MNNICNFCGLYGCDSNECILNNNHDVCICCGLKGHSKNVCSLNKLINDMDNIAKEIVNYIIYNFPDTIIYFNNLYNINPIQKNIIIKYKNNNSYDYPNNIKYANIILTTLDGKSVYKYYYILYNDGYIEAGSE